jgi:endoplasmic reticulum junction formation protein lunapark
VNSNSEQLDGLRTEKRELLDQVKNKETYKDAVEILQRFGGNDRSFSTPARTPTASANVSMDKKMMVNTSTNMTPTAFNFKTPAARQLMNVNSNVTNLQQRLNAQQTPQSTNRSLMMSTGASVAAINTNKRTPYPIINNAEKTVVDKMVDYLIGDGPANRFAMICQQCFKHNGEIIDGFVCDKEEKKKNCFGSFQVWLFRKSTNTRRLDAHSATSSTLLRS